MTSSDVQAFARALHETLVGTVLEQLRAAVPNLSDVESSAADVEEKINGALPDNALPEVRNFLLVLAREGALGQLPAIINTFENYGQRGPQALQAHVTSAVELSDEQRERIGNELNQRYQAELDMHFDVDESLIGGLIIRVGDQVLDNSLRTRLGMLQRSMLTS